MTQSQKNSGKLTLVLPTADGLTMVVSCAARPRVLQWKLPLSTGWGDPAAAKDLASLLAAENIRLSGNVCCAVADDWVVLKSLQLPRPQQAELLESMVDMAIENNFADSAAQLSICWCAGGRPTDAQLPVTLCALSQARLGAVVDLCSQAGIKIVAATPISAAIATAGGQSRWVLLSYGKRITLTLAAKSAVLAHYSFHSDDAELIDSQLENIAAATGTLYDSSSTDLIYCGDRQQAGAIAEKLGISNIHQVGPLEWTDENPSVALSAAAWDCGVSLTKPPLNFLAARDRSHRKFKSQSVKRAALWAAIGFVIVLAGALHWYLLSRDIANLRYQSKSMSDELKVVTHSQQMLAASDEYFDGQSLSLDVLSELTQNFPEPGSLWLNSLSVKIDGTTAFSGRAASSGDVIEFLDTLQQNSHFDGITREYIRNLSGGRSGVSFAASCVFNRDQAK